MISRKPSFFCITNRGLNFVHKYRLSTCYPRPSSTKRGPVPVQAREFHNQQLIKDVRSLGKQMTTASLRIVVNQIQDLHSCRRENGIRSLLDRLDLHSVLQADKERLFGLLGRLSLESDAKKLILKLQTVDEDHKQNLSNFIHLYTMDLSKKLDFVVRKLRLLHRQLNVATTPRTYNSMIEMCLDRKEASLAVDVVGFMLEDGHTVDINVLNRILESCRYACEFSLVKVVHTMMCDWEIKPNEITIERMICLFMKMNDPTEAKRLLREVRRFDIHPTTNMYNAILAGYFGKSRLPYFILNYLSMYKALMVRGESSIAQTMVEHISGDDIHEHVDRIRNACDKGV